jgi:acetyl-CoA C-acetyltransferase
MSILPFLPDIPLRSYPDDRSVCVRRHPHAARQGKKDGSLHEVKPIDLLAGTLQALRARHDLDTAAVDDVVMGIVSPIGEQGSVLPKVAALKAGWDWRCAGMQVNRFCASGLEAVNLAAQKVRSGWEDLVVAGGVRA